MGRDGRLPEGETSRCRCPAADEPSLIPRMRLAASLTAAVCAVARGRNAGARGAARRRLPRLPARQPVEPARRPAAASHAQLRRDRALDRPRATRCTPTSAPGLWDGGPIGIPYVTVGGASSPRARVASTTRTSPTAAATRSRARAPIEGGRERGRRPPRDRRRPRALPALRAVRRLPASGGERWRAGSGAIWNLRSNRLRPRGWTSADAAGLPILPGLARYDEVKRGAIDHALRFTASAHAPRVRLPGAALRLDLDRPEPARDGPAPAAQARLRHLALPAPGAHRADARSSATG